MYGIITKFLRSVVDSIIAFFAKQKEPKFEEAEESEAATSKDFSFEEPDITNVEEGSADTDSSEYYTMDDDLEETFTYTVNTSRDKKTSKRDRAQERNSEHYGDFHQSATQ